MIKNKKKQRGQILIEFLIVMIIMLTMMFMLVQLAFGIAWGHYVQYATFMSSRALLSARSVNDDQFKAAADELAKLLKNSDGSKDLMSFVSKPRAASLRDIPGGAEPVAGAFIGAQPFAAGNGLNSRSFGWAEGVQYNYEVPLFLFPGLKWLASGNGKTINIINNGESSPPVTWNGRIPLTSESWLGRERSNRECLDDMRNMANDNTIRRADGAPFVLDNGC